MLTALLGPYLALHLFTAQAINTEVLQGELAYASDKISHHAAYVHVTVKSEVTA